MENENIINKISKLQRGLGIIDGIASGIDNDLVSNLLYRARCMIEEAVEELIKLEYER